jgi:UDP-N-acetylglucosamine 4,6-dehydratase
VHAAALKHVPILEYNPFEAVKTNILGSQNVINAAIDQGVEKVVLVSTDKAAQPVNLYGSTKLCAEKLFINGNFMAGGKTKFACVRYGNVIGSRGSIIDTLAKTAEKGDVKITDDRMTRFWITLEQSHQLVMFALENMVGGETFIPKIPSMKLVDLFKAIIGDTEIEVMGIRPGEKLHEILLTEQEAMHALELEKYYVVLPEFMDMEKYEKYHKIGEKLECDFRFTSDTNKDWLTHDQFKDYVKKI